MYLSGDQSIRVNISYVEIYVSCSVLLCDQPGALGRTHLRFSGPFCVPLYHMCGQLGMEYQEDKNRTSLVALVAKNAFVHGLKPV